MNVSNFLKDLGYKTLPNSFLFLLQDKGLQPSADFEISKLWSASNDLSPPGSVINDQFVTLLFLLIVESGFIPADLTAEQTLKNDLKLNLSRAEAMKHGLVGWRESGSYYFNLVLRTLPEPVCRLVVVPTQAMLIVNLVCADQDVPAFATVMDPHHYITEIKDVSSVDRDFKCRHLKELSLRVKDRLAVPLRSHILNKRGILNASLLGVPCEVVWKILEYLNTFDKLRMSETCRSLHNAVWAKYTLEELKEAKNKQVKTNILCQREAEMALTRTCSLTWSAGRIVLVERRGYTSHHHAVTALRSKKAKSKRNMVQHFVDVRAVRAVGGTGGDGDISFLQLWSNETAGPDGGDGGNGGHVVLEASLDVRDLNHVSSILKADPGERGYNKDCSGKNAAHTVVKVPLGTIVKTATGRVIADLSRDGSMFVAARGGAGGHGNHFFVSDTAQSPQVAEFGAQGEDLQYVLEVRSMAHIGLIGLPNAGKSTLLQAISRARPKIAPYPFTTLKPHLGMVQYDDYEQIAVADLPGLISGSHQNKGLGIAFLKHAERCAALMFVVDLSCSEPWRHVDLLRYELGQFSSELIRRPQVVVGNKLDLPESKENLATLKERIDVPIIPISAKVGTNLSVLLQHIRSLYDQHLSGGTEE